MALPTNLTFYADLALSLLLALTLVYCIVLERRLSAVRKGQEGLKTHIGELNMAIAGAGASLRALKVAAGEAAQTLDERLKRARLHIDELSVITAAGERIAQRLEGSVERAAPARKQRADHGLPNTNLSSANLPSANLPSASVMSRLDSLRSAQ